MAQPGLSALGSMQLVGAGRRLTKVTNKTGRG